MAKKILSALLVLAMIFTAMPMSILAADADPIATDTIVDGWSIPSGAWGQWSNTLSEKKFSPALDLSGSNGTLEVTISGASSGDYYYQLFLTIGGKEYDFSSMNTPVKSGTVRIINLADHNLTDDDLKNVTMIQSNACFTDSTSSMTITVKAPRAPVKTDTVVDGWTIPSGTWGQWSNTLSEKKFSPALDLSGSNGTIEVTVTGDASGEYYYQTYLIVNGREIDLSRQNDPVVHGTTTTYKLSDLGLTDDDLKNVTKIQANACNTSGEAAMILTVKAPKPVAVAKIGEVEYFDLAEALAAIKEGDVVTIYEGTYDAALTIKKNNVTVIGEGEVVLNGTPTFKGENYKVENIDFVYEDSYNNLGGSGLIKDCTLTATTNNVFRWCYGNGGAIAFEGCTLTAAAGGWAIHFDEASGTDVTFTDCVITGKVALPGDLGSLDATNTLFKDAYVNVWGSEDGAAFTGCTFENIPYIFTGYTADNTVEFTDCAVVDTENPEATVADIIYDGIDNTNTNIIIDGVVSTGEAYVGGTRYPTLQAAIDAAAAGDTVVLAKDINVNLADNGAAFTVAKGKEITLDLNGHYIAGPGSAVNKTVYIIANYGTLTVCDSSEAKTGYIKMETTSAWSQWVQATAISNCGKFTLESGTILAKRGGSSTAMTYAIDTNSTTATAETIINGGVIESDYLAIRAFANSKVNIAKITVNGGDISTASKSVFFLQQPGNTTDPRYVELNINGGTMTSPANSLMYFWSEGESDEVSPYVVNITGGTLNYDAAKGFVTTSDNDTYGVDIELTGGTYSTDVSEYAAEGFKATENEDGTFGIAAAAAGIISDSMLVVSNMEIKESNGNTYYTIEFANAIDSLEYSEVGYLISATDSVTGREASATFTASTVYEAMKVTTSDGTIVRITADTLGGTYMYGHSIWFNTAEWTNEGTEIVIVPYVVTLDGETIKGVAKVITDAAIKAENPDSQLFREAN